ncbi:hypothetical protein [Paraburkholderia caballeronis]|uniref:Lipoprotein n=1 Tax=Paraburkholderia caballeronis TaxID=416943 RepID=A0A1H7QGT4_9BURK|nr:hypothetical protein [Paraburkholderia caballeronis]PXW22564.1 hypothetical protein C7403_114140 [Paraburkholderia caballeronis]PXW96435.1 hypothetical protein C7407_114140 [Paraburkholderia caballeronis]RAJ92846.1 hypothetical protein C7409_114140 [Paraburkholderia caballeronis]TDV14994.1 hypothetical protein C7408_107106 [Paraburkholderia caballeronis]TDV16882.1 hypothetical protein C7406_107143 [Paraburkholderia caballeronis]
MRRSKLLLGAAAVAVVCASGAAHAARVGVFIGGGVPYYYPVAPVPYYYAPAPVVVAPPPAPPTYIEQGPDGQPQTAPYQQGGPGPAPQGRMPPAPQADPSQAATGDTWYFCDASKTYYPYVKECASGWRAVPAQPAPESDMPE